MNHYGENAGYGTNPLDEVNDFILSPMINAVGLNLSCTDLARKLCGEFTLHLKFHPHATSDAVKAVIDANPESRGIRRTITDLSALKKALNGHPGRIVKRKYRGPFFL